MPTRRAARVTVAHDYDLSLFVPPGLAVEVRGMDVGRPGLVVAGYVGPDCPPKVLAAHCRREYAREGQPPPSGIYFTPHGRTIPAGMNPKPGAWTAARRPLTEDGDVPARRFLFVDIDRRKTPDTMHLSATDDEKVAAGELAGRVQDTMTGLGWSAPLKVDSGNGYHLYYRLSTPQPGGPAADPLADPLAILLRLLGEQLNTDAAEIDRKVFNANRITKLPGTMARKGPSTDDRPHRLCQVVSVPAGWNPAEADQAADVLRAIESLDPGGAIRARWRVSIPKAAASGTAPSRPRVIERAAAYLTSPNTPPAIQGQDGSGRTLYVAQALTHGFELDAATALGLLLAHFNPRCEPAWSVKELEHKVAEAVKKPLASKPRGWLLADDREQLPEAPPFLPLAVEEAAVTRTPPAVDETVQPADRSGVNELPDDPHRLARLVLAGHRRGNYRGLVYWRNEFHEYRGAGYVARDDDDFTSRLNASVQRIAVHESRLKATEAASNSPPANGKVESPPPKLKVTKPLVGNVAAAMAGYCTLAPLADKEASAPMWIDGDPARPPASQVVPVANGLVHLPRYAAGEPNAVLPHTPAFFAPPGPAYRVDPAAPQPARWLDFLSQVWPNDPASVGLLQEWFGYLLSPDTTQEKMLMLVGQSGGGKGTILKVLAALVGPHNVANPNLHDFGTPFGLWGLIGKSVAMVGDAQSNGLGQSAGIVVQNLLKISGQDPVMIDRKQLSLLQIKLACRLVFASNEIIRLPNTAGAFARRWSVLKFTQDFRGRRDIGLAARLTDPTELAGIFNWAAAGWARLHRVGAFSDTADSRAATAELVTAGSPVAEFVADRCRVADGATAGRSELFDAWKRWCQENDQRPGSAAEFGRRLRAYLPAIVDRRPRVDGELTRVYVGIGLAPEIPGYGLPDDRLPGEANDSPEPQRQAVFDL